MKIAFFLPNLGGGGAERMQVHLANTLALRGHDVSVVVANAAGPVRGRLSPAVSLVDLKKERCFAALLPLAQYLHRSRPQILISAISHANVIAILARLLAPFSGSKVIATERISLSRILRDESRWWRLAFPLLPRLVYPLAAKVVGVSQGVADEVQALAKLPDEKIATVYNPTIAAELAELLAEEPGYQDLLALKRPIVATVGRLQPQKDHACLLRAFSRSAGQHAAILVIFGEGPLRQDLEDQAEELGIADRVFFPGFVANPLAFLKRCDLFVLSSRYEGFPNVLAEALYCGLPIVSTDCPHGPAEVLDGGRFGSLVPVGDEAALAEAMTAALVTRHDPEAQRRRAMEFSAEATADRYEALFGEILHARRNKVWPARRSVMDS